MAKRPIAGKITVAEGIATVDLHVGAQTVRLTIESARGRARARYGRHDLGFEDPGGEKAEGCHPDTTAR